MIGSILAAGVVLAVLIGVGRALGAEAEVLRHWSHLIEGLEYSPQEFYYRLCDALQRRQIPSVTLRYAVFHEGAWLLSGQRLYLRIHRGEQHMDICAAPFGQGFFFSWWLVVPPGILRQIPVIGWIINALSPATYFKLDTAIMFQTAVHAAVLETIDGITNAKGIRALTADERKPIMKRFA